MAYEHIKTKSTGGTAIPGGQHTVEGIVYPSDSHAKSKLKEDLLSRGQKYGIETPRTEEQMKIKDEVKKQSSEYHGGDINEFIAHMSKAEGYARQARFAVDIPLPGGLTKLATRSRATTAPGQSGGARANLPGAMDMLEMSKSMGRQMNIHCDSISMPGHDMQSVDHTTFGPKRVIPVGHGFDGTITASFYADLYLRERHYLEAWQKVVVNNLTHKANYYDDYVGSMKIYQLDNDGRATYGIEATEVYPEQISAVAYDYSRASSIVKLSCEFQYRQWYNLATESINNT